MNDPAAFAGTYHDFRTVKTRSAFQVIVEMPIEQADKFIAAFGMPIPGAEKPVALALLSSVPATSSPTPQGSGGSGKRRFAELPRSQQSALMCEDASFREWIGAKDSEHAALAVRDMCAVKSRAEFDRDDMAGLRWDGLLLDYRSQTGRMAEQRG